MGSWARLSVGAVLVCALAGCTGTGSQVSLAGHAHSSQEALLRARALLDRVYLPGAVRTDTPVLSLSGGGADQVEEQRWFTVPGYAERIIAALVAHPPAGLESWEPPFQTTATSAPLSMIAVGLRPVGQVDLGQTLEVLASDQGNGRARLTMDALVGWVGRHSALETIPDEVTDAQLAISFANQPDEAMNRDNAMTAAQLHELTSLLNGLQVDAPGGSSLCVEADLATAVLTVTYAGHHAAFAIEVGGCANVNVTVDGVAQPTLTDDRGVTHLVGVILGINL